MGVHVSMCACFCTERSTVLLSSKTARGYNTLAANRVFSCLWSSLLLSGVRSASRSAESLSDGHGCRTRNIEEERQLQCKYQIFPEVLPNSGKFSRILVFVDRLCSAKIKTSKF